MLAHEIIIVISGKKGTSNSQEEQGSGEISTLERFAGQKYAYCTMPTRLF
jgi:hypothetical protein